MAANNGVYWMGADGKVYVQGAQGTNAAGVADNNSNQYWQDAGYSRIDNPLSAGSVVSTGGNSPDGPGSIGYDLPGYGGGPNVTGSTPSAPAVDQNLINSYNQSIGNTKSALDLLAPTQQQGNQTIDVDAQNALSRLLLGKNQGLSSYNDNKTKSSLDFVKAKNSIGAQAGGALNGLRRLMGSRGWGGGSAYLQSAPDAVGRNATLQRGDVTDTYGDNSRTADTNWGNYLQGYDNSVLDVNSQRDQRKQTLQQQINTQNATLLQQMADLTGRRDQAAGGNSTDGAQTYLDQANTLLKQNTDYRAAPINYQTQAYTPPSAASYTTTPQNLGTSQQSNDYVSPYFSALMGKKQKTAFA